MGLTISIIFDTETGCTEFHLPTDFLMAQQLLTAALNESCKRELAQRIEQKHPGVVLQRNGVHLLKKG